MGADGCLSVPDVEQRLLPTVFGVASSVICEHRGLQTGLHQPQHCVGRKRSQGEMGSAGRDHPATCPLLHRVPGKGAEASPFDKEGKIILSKPQNSELLGLYLSRQRKRLCSLPLCSGCLSHTQGDGENVPFVGYSHQPTQHIN